MEPLRVRIYRDRDHPEAWLDVPAMEMMDRVLDAARTLAGDQPDTRIYLIDVPHPGNLARRVGEIVVQGVQDESLYTVQERAPDADTPPATRALVGQVDPRRRPAGAPGTWVAQAIAFDKALHTPDAARQWIAQHSALYVDAGVEEDQGTLRFPQYAPHWFEYFKQVAVAPGISVVYGSLAATPVEAAKAAAALAAIGSTYAAVHRVSTQLSDRGLAVIKAATATDAEAEERYILGIVLEPTLLADGTTRPDTQGDVYTAATIRDAAHRWLSAYGHVDLMHNWQPLAKGQVQVLESYLAPATFEMAGKTVVEGTWLLALRILDDALWQAVKDGTLGAYSIGGTAASRSLEEESHA